MKILTAAVLLFAGSSFAQPPPKPPTNIGKHPFTFEDMMALKRVSEPVPSPDGKWVVFAAEDVNLDENTKKSHLWIVPAAGGEARRLNTSQNAEERPRFSPDGQRIIFTSKATDPAQTWMCDLDASDGALSGKPHQVTNISTGAGGAIWSPDGKNAFRFTALFKTFFNAIKFGQIRIEHHLLAADQVNSSLDSKCEHVGFHETRRPMHCFFRYSRSASQLI